MRSNTTWMAGESVCRGSNFTYVFVVVPSYLWKAFCTECEMFHHVRYCISTICLHVCYCLHRFFCSSEASWRLTGFDTDSIYPSVERLQVHDEGGQQVCVKEGEPVSNALDREARTTLTEWFVMNNGDPEANQYTYLEFPLHYTWNKNTKRWSKRRNNRQSVGRMYNTLPGVPPYMYHLLKAPHCHSSHAC